MADDFIDPQLRLESLRARLATLENVIFPFRSARTVYPLNPGAFQIQQGNSTSIFDRLLHARGVGEAESGRYLFHEEVPFFDNLPKAKVQRSRPANPLNHGKVNENQWLTREYIAFLSTLCRGEDIPETHGNSASIDVSVLHELSSRVHLGRHVAESKFQTYSAVYIALLQLGNTDGMMALITNKPQEELVLERVRNKSVSYGLDPLKMGAFYDNKLIPTTKRIEVLYLSQRECPKDVIAQPYVEEAKRIITRKDWDHGHSNPVFQLLDYVMKDAASIAASLGSLQAVPRIGSGWGSNWTSKLDRKKEDSQIEQWQTYRKNVQDHFSGQRGPPFPTRPTPSPTSLKEIYEVVSTIPVDVQRVVFPQLAKIYAIHPN